MEEFQILICDCNKVLNILRPEYINFRTSHVHCKECNLEWHLNWRGEIYSHPWKVDNGETWNNAGYGDRMKYLRKHKVKRKLQKFT